MPDEVKQLLKAGCLTIWIGSTLMGVLWFFSLQKQFNDRVAEDVRDVGRSLALRNEMSQEASAYLENGDVQGYQAAMDRYQERAEEQAHAMYEARKKRYPGLDWDKIEERNGYTPPSPRERTQVAVANRIPGAYYPEDHVVEETDDSGASLMAAGIAGAGGLAIFLGTGFVAWRILGAGAPEEEDGAGEEGEESYVVIGGEDGEPLAPAGDEAYEDEPYAEDAYDEPYDDGSLAGDGYDEPYDDDPSRS